MGFFSRLIWTISNDTRKEAQQINMIASWTTFLQWRLTVYYTNKYFDIQTGVLVYPTYIHLYIFPPNCIQQTRYLNVTIISFCPQPTTIVNTKSKWHQYVRTTSTKHYNWCPRTESIYLIDDTDTNIILTINLPLSIVRLINLRVHR